VKPPSSSLLRRGRRALLLSALVLFAGVVVGIVGFPAGEPATTAPGAPPPIAAGYRPTPRPPALPASARADDPELAGVPAAAILTEGVELRFVERAAEEWQGMRVPDYPRPICNETAGCGGGLTCLPDGTCGACTRDDQCLRDEVCALDHCLKRANVTCRRKANCDQSNGRALCILSGYSEDPRHNADMRSECNADNGPPRKPTFPAPYVSDLPPGPPPSLDPRQMLDSLREAN
jgi:hypothetical protein